MKRSILFSLIILFLYLSVSAFTLSTEDLNRFFDLSVTIKTLDLALKENNVERIDTSRFVLLNGTVSSVIVLNTKRDQYEVVLKVISGEWMGTDEVKSYRVFVDFKGSNYYTMIPRRKPRHPKGNEILNNTSVIIVARILEPILPPGAQSEEDTAWFLEGLYIRKIY